MAAAKTGIDGVINPQPVAAPLTWSAIFLVVTINPGPDHRSTVRSFCADLPALFRAVEFRNLEAGLIPPPKRLEFESFLVGKRRKLLGELFSSAEV